MTRCWADRELELVLDVASPNLALHRTRPPQLLRVAHRASVCDTVASAGPVSLIVGRLK